MLLKKPIHCVIVLIFFLFSILDRVKWLVISLRGVMGRVLARAELGGSDGYHGYQRVTAHHESARKEVGG